VKQHRKETVKKGLFAKLQSAQARHQERNRPTGFQFALGDRIDFMHPGHWNTLTAKGSIFLQTRYLRALEQTAPENLSPRYALAFRGDKPVAAIALQIVTITGSTLLQDKPDKKSKLLGRVVKTLGAGLKERALVCGNLLAWGNHGVAFAPDEDPATLWPAVAEVIYRIRRAEKLSGQTDFALIKDLSEPEFAPAESLEKFSYRSVETDPDMVLHLREEWRSYEDYLGSLDRKYRYSAKQIAKEIAAAGCVVESLSDLQPHGNRLHQLYTSVQQNAPLRPISLHQNYLPSLATALGADFRCSVVRKNHDLLGFITTLKNGDSAIGYYIGFDRTAAETAPIYLQLLHASVADALALGCKNLSLGRTALEPKARLGAKPVPLKIWLRHRTPVLNVAIRGLLGAIPHGEAPERNPFKNTGAKD
jgi:hypothetical protein